MILDTQRNIASYLYIRGLISEDATLEDILLMASKVEQSFTYLNDNLVIISNQSAEATEEEIQTVFYNAGKIHFESELRLWFKIIYEVFFKEDNGPRLGQFTKLVGYNWIFDKLYKIQNNPYAMS